MANGIVLTNVGQGWICQALANAQGADSADYHTNTGAYVGHGTGTTTPAAADTALQTESSDARAAVTATVTGSTSTAKYQGTSAAITSGGTQAITEAALMSASSTGGCFIHTVFSAVNLVANDTITYVFTIDPS